MCRKGNDTLRKVAVAAASNLADKGVLILQLDRSQSRRYHSCHSVAQSFSTTGDSRLGEFTPRTVKPAGETLIEY